MHAEDIIFHVGDILHDETLGDVGILLECYDSHRDYEGHPESFVIVWKTWWIKAGEENYSEHGLQNLVAMDVFVCYSVYSCNLHVI
jgi:hypothetical protein